MSVPSKIFRELCPDDLGQLEEFARDRRNTSQKCFEWLLAHGYTMSQSSVDRWKRQFDSEDRYRASATLASELMTAKANAEGGGVAIADANNAKMHQLIFDKLIRLEENGEDVPTKDLLGLAMALRAGAATKKDIEELKKTQAAAIAAAENAAKGGASADDAITIIKKSLGIIPANAIAGGKAA